MSEQLWYWRGLTADGDAQSGTLWAAHRPAALLALQRQHITVTKLKRRTVNGA